MKIKEIARNAHNIMEIELKNYEFSFKENNEYWPMSSTLFYSDKKRSEYYVLFRTSYDYRDDSDIIMELRLGKGVVDFDMDQMEIEYSSISLIELGYLLVDELAISLDDSIEEIHNKIYKMIMASENFLKGIVNDVLYERNTRNVKLFEKFKEDITPIQAHNISSISQNQYDDLVSRGRELFTILKKHIE